MDRSLWGAVSIRPGCLAHTRPILLISAAAALTFAASARQAMPVSGKIDSSSSPQITLAAGGCGIGWRRGPYGGCRPNRGPIGADLFGAAPDGASTAAVGAGPMAACIAGKANEEAATPAASLLFDKVQRRPSSMSGNFCAERAPGHLLQPQWHDRGADRGDRDGVPVRRGNTYFRSR
jgi:hypothetical protein